mmetsp:Transcript_29836/g.96270  ORF Transcript_29836/g.96270 Transcript_29836/m.96270 type:complete len:156 (+) Transcript_29836:1534-2001(+)
MSAERFLFAFDVVPFDAAAGPREDAAARAKGGAFPPVVVMPTDVAPGVVIRTADTEIKGTDFVDTPAGDDPALQGKLDHVAPRPPPTSRRRPSFDRVRPLTATSARSPSRWDIHGRRFVEAAPSWEVLTYTDDEARLPVPLALPSSMVTSACASL